MHYLRLNRLPISLLCAIAITSFAITYFFPPFVYLGVLCLSLAILGVLEIAAILAIGYWAIKDEADEID